MKGSDHGYGIDRQGRTRHRRLARHWRGDRQGARRGGATVAISYAASADRASAVVSEIEAAGGTARAFRADQADAVQAAELVKGVHAAFGRLDILVNNAGIYVQGSPFDPSTNWDAIARQYAVNLHGVVAAIRAAAPLLEEDGRIISIGSGLGSRVPFPGIADYAATKRGRSRRDPMLPFAVCRGSA